jgi:hypothetical protein
MNTAKYILIPTLIVTLFSCQDVKKETFNYAEISIAKGGQWEEAKYVNRTSFKKTNELKLPNSHTDHSSFIRYEGPGWESDKVAYRLYLDWRNAIDVFGKKTNQMILESVGQDGYDSYHKMQDWGMDILKVGNSLGLGSFGRYDGNEVHHFKKVDSTLVSITNKTDYSAVNIDYFGWTTADVSTDLRAALTINSGSRITKVVLNRSTTFEGLCTGIVNHNVDFISTHDNQKKWSYMATYGNQSLVPDRLGMVLFYKTDQVEVVKEGLNNHLVVFRKEPKNISYYFAAFWEQEPGGITSKEDFVKYIDKQLDKLLNQDFL